MDAETYADAVETREAYLSGLRDGVGLLQENAVMKERWKTQGLWAAVALATIAALVYVGLHR
ncbi:MAG: hypothetical protein F4X54_07470 [Chloroflexi bacterium]|nr:hypothetical protein [Chloroflexota bacterium]MYB84557.1 hypothetical protein [Chloroflexota bacterium]